MARGAFGLPQCRARRAAIPWRTYWAWMRLARRPLCDPLEPWFHWYELPFSQRSALMAE